MIVSVLVRLVACAAFLGFGIAWMSDHDEVLAWLWIGSFVLAAATTVWYGLTDETRAGVARLGIPWPSTSRDYRDYL